MQLDREQQKALREAISNRFPKAKVRVVTQDLYLPDLREMNSRCAAVMRGLSQALFLGYGILFVNNLKALAKMYERKAKDKQISEREEREACDFSRLLNNFEGQLDSTKNSLPSNLIRAKDYKTLNDLSCYIAGIKGDFAVHLVTSDHVVAIYRTGDDYAYFDSNIAFVSELKSVDQLIEIVEMGVKSAGYEVGEKGLLVEHFDVDKANSLLSDKDKQVLTEEIKREHQLTASNEGQKKTQVSEASSDKPESYLSGVKVNNQPKRSQGF